MPNPARRRSASAFALALLLLATSRATPTALGDDQEKPLAIAIEEKRAEVKKLEAAAQALRESFQRRQRDEVAAQEIAIKQADAHYQNAKLTRQVAEIAVVEFKEGTSAIQGQKAEGELSLAKAELRRAKEAFEQAKSTASKLRLDQAKFKLETAETELEILGKFTKPRTLKELESEVERAKSNELHAEAMLNLEKSKARRVQQNAAERESPAPEQQVLTLLDESIVLEDKVRAILFEAKDLEEKAKQDPAALAAELKKKRAEAADLSAKARRQLDEAIFIAKEVADKRSKLRSVEQELQKAYAELDALAAKSEVKSK